MKRLLAVAYYITGSCLVWIEPKRKHIHNWAVFLRGCGDWPYDIGMLTCQRQIKDMFVEAADMLEVLLKCGPHETRA